MRPISRPVKSATLYDQSTAIERSLEATGHVRPKSKYKNTTPVSLTVSQLVRLRSYQSPVFRDRKTGIVVLHWARQIGKSFTLAAWAVDRLITRPGRLVTVLSNSRDNGAEFLAKCIEICDLNHTFYETDDDLKSLREESLRMELRIPNEGQIGRIKILAANPRTARGFSGDLILDEFAFHEDAAAIWEAVEPILSSSQDFLCRIASTGNGCHNLFYRLALPGGEPSPAEKEILPPTDGPGMGWSQCGFRLSRVPRTLAHSLGVPIYDSSSREEIDPETARAVALDKHGYDQNYECAFADESLTLLSHELITAAERDGVGLIGEQDWPAAALALLRQARGSLYAGFDVARCADLSVICVIEKWDEKFLVRAMLRMRDLSLPEQQKRLGEICRLPKFQRAAIDMTGLGLGLVEFAQKEFNSRKICGVNFASTVPVSRTIRADGTKGETVRVTEAMAMELLRAYEHRRIQHPADTQLHDDLRKPEKITSPGGRVSIAATRDDAGHADHFWSLALALKAAADFMPAHSQRVELKARRLL